jgi:hypothetical protein
MSAGLDVLGAALWTPTQPSLVAAAARDLAAISSARPETQLLAARARGRASLLTLMLANVVERASQAAGVDPGSVPTIYGSAYGEMTTTMALLDMLHADDGRLSPAKFQASVHNTAGGQISISQGNRSFSTSIAAGHDTLAMALIEAWAWLTWRPGVVVVACADESAPPVLVPGPPYGSLALALVLSNVSNATNGRPPLARLGRLVQTTTPHDAAAERENPCAAGLALVRAICTPVPDAIATVVTIVLNRAARQPWQIDVLSTSQGP